MGGLSPEAERVRARRDGTCTPRSPQRAGPAAWRPAVAPPTPHRLAADLGGRLPPRGARIGLLGGSFNPAHGGHRRISHAALQRLGLDEVWWLVSPQNPLKPRSGMAPLETRLTTAQAVIAGHPRLRATAVEGTLGTLYTADTIAALCQRFPGVRFVWLMGADNLAQIDRWHRWRAIFESVPIAVLDRPAYSYSVTSAKAAIRYGHARIAEEAARRLAEATPPAWVFVHQPRDPRSATRIRARKTGTEGAPCEPAGRTPTRF